MEENKEEKNTGYTGEYGNSVEGDYQDNSQPTTYRYSYKDGEGESTHSGDYYASQNQQGTAESEKPSDSEGQEKWKNSQDNYCQSDNSGYQNAGQQSDTYQGNSYQNSGWQNNNYQNGSYQNNNNYYNNQYQNGAYRNNGYQNANGNVPKKEGVSTGKKFLITIACAVVFGIVASICFNVVDYAAQRIFGSTGRTENVQLGKTTDNAPAATATPRANNSSVNKQVVSDVSAIAEQSMPAVVAITSTTQGTDYYDLFGQYYQGRDTTSCGSGFIVGQNDKELLIATNNHVIDKAKTISVQFIDGEIYEATKKGADSSNDLAVIAVKASDVKKSTMEKIKIADLGDSEQAKVGEMVIAIGNALGYGQSVTVGYISAKDREITESSENGSAGNKIKAIQTDAAINPGNSGGALLNMQGQVVGINSAKIADSTVEGVGYAIPISVAIPIIDELMNREELTEDEMGYLGISGRPVSQEAVAYNVPYGVYVAAVGKGSAAEKAGIKVNDVITAVNKMEVTTMESLREKVNSYRKGTKIEITLKRSNNGTYEEKKVTVTLQGKEALDNLPDHNSQSGESDSREEDNSGNNGRGSSPYGNGGGSIWDFFQ